MAIFREWKRIKKVIEAQIRKWDPIDLGREFGDELLVAEYNEYIDRLVSLICRGAGENDLLTYLLTVEEKNMGLQPREERASAFIEIILSEIGKVG